MYISRVRLENIRGFSGSRNVDLTLTRPDGSHAGWTVIAGRNGSGKTSLLRAIALSVSTSFAAPSLMPDLRDWITTGQIDGTVKSWLRADPDVDDWPEQTEKKVTTFTVSRHWKAHFSVGSPQRRSIGPLPIQTASLPFAEKLTIANRFGWFCAAYGPFRRLVGGTAEAQRLMQAPSNLARMASLFNEDASLAEGVQWLIEQHLRALEDRPGAKTLKRFALSILADGLLPDSYQVAEVDSDGLWVSINNERFPLREMSDGYRTVTALVVDLLKQLNDAYGNLAFQVKDNTPTITSPGVVIIDEADAHLHVSWQKRIGGWLKTHFPNIQFIVTTHSPYICQAADPGGLIRLPGPHEDEPPRVVEPELYERIIFGSGDDAVLSELFGLDSPYSERADELRSKAVSLENKVVAEQASEQEIADYLELRRQLNSSPATRAREVEARLEAAEDDNA